MQKAKPKIAEVLSKLEKFYGPQQPSWPTEPYEFLVWWHCGYPASDALCSKGWESLNRHVGAEPGQLLTASTTRLVKALVVGGMVPDLRAQRLRDIATRVQLKNALFVPLTQIETLAVVAEI